MTGLVCCTLDCNLACSYCYEGNGEKHENPKINVINEKFIQAKEKIIQFIDELYEYNHEGFTKIIWHGGEPTLIKYSLLDEIMKDQANKGHDNVVWSMQSNGTLLTQSYIDVLKENKVSVGISLDGLREQHDRYRRFKNGNPTFDVIINNIHRLQENGVRCGTLITITDNNVDYLLEIYEFFADLDVSFNFNALFPDKKENTPRLNVKEYSKKICDLFDKWISDEEHHIVISPFMHIIEGLLKPERGIPACHWSKDCSKSFTAIDIHGNLYPCEHWVGMKEYSFGNITNGLEKELKNNTFFENRKQKLQDTDCAGCKIWEFCYGGCPWNGWTIFGDIDRKDASVCEGRKIIIEHIKQYLLSHGKLN
jgi:uncharacterized protein